MGGRGGADVKWSAHAVGGRRPETGSRLESRRSQGGRSRGQNRKLALTSKTALTMA